MKILVTGGTGFLGKAVVRQLLAAGEQVRVLARTTPPHAEAELAGAEIVYGDIRDRAGLDAALAGVQAVCHCAARVATDGPWSVFEEVTVRGTANLLQAAAAQRLEMFLHVSSLGVYGPGNRTTITEDAPFDDDAEGQGNYSRAKIAAERLVWEFARKHDLPCTVMRPGILYGPPRPPFLPRLRVAAGGHLLAAFGPRRQRLPLIYVENAAEAIRLALRSEQTRGRSYNLVDDEAIVLGDYLTVLRQLKLSPPLTVLLPPAPLYGSVMAGERVCRMLGRTLPVSRHKLDRVFASPHFDTTRARAELGWRPRVGLQEGLRRVREAQEGRPT